MVQCGPELCGNDPKWRDEEDERSSGAQGEIAAHRVDVRRPLVAGSFGPEPVARVARHRLPLETACARREKAERAFLDDRHGHPYKVTDKVASVDQRVLHGPSTACFEARPKRTAKPL